MEIYRAAPQTETKQVTPRFTKLKKPKARGECLVRNYKTEACPQTLSCDKQDQSRNERCAGDLISLREDNPNNGIQPNFKKTRYGSDGNKCNQRRKEVQSRCSSVSRIPFLILETQRRVPVLVDRVTLKFCGVLHTPPNDSRSGQCL